MVERCTTWQSWRSLLAVLSGVIGLGRYSRAEWQACRVLRNQGSATCADFAGESPSSKSRWGCIVLALCMSAGVRSDRHLSKDVEISTQLGLQLHETCVDHLR